MHQILITGATGFVGSALAANLLARGAGVTAVSRNDPDGVRTLNAVLSAAHGCGLDISGAVKQHLRVVNIDFAELENGLSDAALADITEVWHVAAEMSYSAHKLAQSFGTNVGTTARLYHTVAQRAPSCRRFYYVSTAYVAGMAGGPVPEQLHAQSHMVNTYQVTKWSAEQSLHLLHQRHQLPVSVFRPTVVVGHSQTGWTHRNGFGFYMFQDAVLAIARAGHRELTVDLLPHTRPDLVPIDRLASDACSLTLRADAGTGFEVFHSAGGTGVAMQELVHIWGQVANVKTRLGAPATSLEQKFDRAVGANRPFALTEWQFERTRLDAATNQPRPLEPLSREQVHALCRWYAGEVAPQREPRAVEAG
ncbi:SDR family oxidoreductase [Microbulbifer sp. SAOS-129_SWC]|uniref:SDR family oxidoreductase n=1 Tax=Microbulbifer sp. SAOS-129_SWC TaxID=3145235 RepID=UPI003216E43D